LVPRGYEFNHIPRKSDRRGGGIGVIYKSGLIVKVSKSKTTEMYTHFENMNCIINIGRVTVKCCIIYRPPPSKQNGFRSSIFFDKWSKYLDNIAIIPYDVILTGDLNFHVYIKYNVKARPFFSILDSHGLTRCTSQRRPHTRFGHL